MNDLPKNEWMDQWQAMSRQYWNAWQDLSREAGISGARDPAGVPWHEGFEQWARMFGNQSGSQSETIERVLASAKSFTAFAQSMIAAATGGGGATPNWSEAMRQGFAMPGGAAGMFDNPVAHALREISGQGTKSFEQMMANFAPYLGQAGFGQGAFDPAREAKSWLGVPAFGFLREHQEHYQKMALGLIEYQEQNGRYNTLILKASKRSFELFESKLAAREEPGRQIDSLRALYDLWVDAAEEAYAEVALSAEFREVYGALVNAQMRMRSQFQQEVERIATDLGMPTRSELDSIGQRLQELRRELRRGGGNVDTSGLAAEVKVLRREVETLKSALAKTAQPSAAAAKPMASASRPSQHKRPRAASAKKSAPKVAALKADVRESVRTLDSEARSPAATRQRRPKKAAATHVQRPAAPSRTKKSVAKVVHMPSRVGNPVQSFAARMAEFARTAHAHARKPARAGAHAKPSRHANKQGGR
jgi:polyhydroxyalkanoate synthase subunit PhaE